MAKKKNYEYSNEELAEIARLHTNFKSPNFSLYVNDILGSNRVLMLSDSAYRGYVNLLLAAWNEPDCGLPTTDPTTVDKLVKLSRIDRRTFEENQFDILQFFFEYQGRLYNRRLLEERIKQIKRRQINKDNINKRYEKATNELPKDLQSYSFSKGVTDKEKENDNDKENDLKEKGGMGGETKTDKGPPKDTHKTSTTEKRLECFTAIAQQNIPERYLPNWKQWVELCAEKGNPVTRSEATILLKKLREISIDLDVGAVIEKAITLRHNGFDFAIEILKKEKYGTHIKSGGFIKPKQKAVGDFNLSDDNEYQYEKFSKPE